MEVVSVFVAAFAIGAKDADAAEPTRSPDNAWAQMVGENTEELDDNIDELSRTRDRLTGEIEALRDRIASGDSRYARDPGLKLADQMELRQKEADLKRTAAVLVRLEKRRAKGVETRTASRGTLERIADTTHVEFIDPTLDLSAKHLGNADVAEYYAEYQVGFQGHALMFQLPGRDAHEKRGQLTVGPDLTDADFYVKDGGRELDIVFTVVDGSHKTLKLEEGVYQGFYDSDAHGKPKRVDVDSD